MITKLSHSGKTTAHPITITGSKSESNRLLILQKLYGNFTIKNLSNSDDTQLLQNALSTDENLIDIYHAGTAMRFLTAYLAIQDGRTTVLTGSARMKERPIGVLVSALRKIGAKINYLEKEGYPPLEIQGASLTKSEVTIKATVSSQYITALMLIGAALSNGLTIHLEGTITSLPYVKMTLAILDQIGITASFAQSTIHIKPLSKELIRLDPVIVESDWSSASYFYSFAALLFQKTKSSILSISTYKSESLQGDASLQYIFKKLGINSMFENGTLHLHPIPDHNLPANLKLDLVESPDIAQTIAVSCFGLGIACELTGLHTLKIKETDRLIALYNEISKLGGEIAVTNDSLFLKKRTQDILPNRRIATYNDHRMAMAFAPLAYKNPIHIEDAKVVSKSYPDFWDDFQKLGFICS